MAIQTETRPLAGEVVVVTGKVAGMTRDQVFEAVYSAGGFNADAVNAKTTLLVIGEKPGATKVSAGVRFGTRTITEAAFRDLIA